MIEYPYVWFWRKRLPERKGQRCRVLVRGKKNSIAVEFEDGYRVVTSRFAVRKVRDAVSKYDDQMSLDIGSK